MTERDPVLWRHYCKICKKATVPFGNAVCIPCFEKLLEEEKKKNATSNARI